jgi:hypothetical protein
MKPYLSYLVYLIRHKWYVFVECCKLGIPWLGIIHDLSKFNPVEWLSAAPRYHGTKEQQEIAKGPYRYSWLHHQKHNKHHWVYWVLYTPTPGHYLEAFAEQAHKSWSGWMQYLFSFGKLDAWLNWVTPNIKTKRWRRQMKTPYDELPEDEKESDRIEAREYLALFDEAKMCLSIPSRYQREMLADWIGAGRAQGTTDNLGWYLAHRDKMLLHPNTRAWIERMLGYES